MPVTDDTDKPIRFKLFYNGPLYLTESQLHRSIFDATKCGCGECFDCVVQKTFLHSQDKWRPMITN